MTEDNMYQRAADRLRGALDVAEARITELARSVEHYANLAGAREREGRHRAEALEAENARLREALKSARDRLVGVSWQGVPLPWRVLVTAVIADVDRALIEPRSSTPATEEKTK